MRIYQKARVLKEMWCSWFAWHPVQCEMGDGRAAWVFGEMVERKETYGYGGASWRYREILTPNVESNLPATRGPQEPR